MDNLEDVLHSLNEFERSAEKNLSPELEQLLQHIAKTGRTVFSWPLLKPLIRFKLEKVLHEFFESGSPSREYNSEPTTKAQDFLPTAEKLINNLNCFSGTPFTIQRICELITEPRKYYKTTDKFLRGVEKTILVVSTVQPDGSLITRSVGPPLTNGTASPTESTGPINSISSPPDKPVHNSLLNTNFPENGTIAIDRLAPWGSDEENGQTATTVEDSIFDKDSENTNPTQNGHSQGNCASEQTSELPCAAEKTSEQNKTVDSEEHRNSENSSLSEIVESKAEEAHKETSSSEKQEEIPEEKMACLQQQILTSDPKKDNDKDKPPDSEKGEEMEH